MKDSSSADMLNSYITDMLALESHIEKAITAQLKDLDDEEPGFASALQQAHETVASHITQLELLAESREMSPGSAVAEHVKNAVSKVAGLGAAAIDLLRHEKLPKDVRDDNAAFRLAEVGYGMLFTSAMVLDDDGAVRELALTHMRDYSRLANSFRDLAPASVLRYLEKAGYPVSEELLARVLEAQREESTTP